MGQYSLSNLDHFAARCDEWKKWRELLRSEIEAIDTIRLTGVSGPAAMIRHVDMSSAELKNALADHEVHVVDAPSHTHHDHVIIRLPSPHELERLTHALTAL